MSGGKLEYYKSIGEPQKGGTKFQNFNGGGLKGGNMIFDSNLVGGDLGGNHVQKTLIIVNAAVKGPTYFQIWAGHCLRAIHIPYTGPYMVEFTQCFFHNNNCNNLSVQ